MLSPNFTAHTGAAGLKVLGLPAWHMEQLSQFSEQEWRCPEEDTYTQLAALTGPLEKALVIERNDPN